MASCNFHPFTTSGWIPAPGARPRFRRQSPATPSSTSSLLMPVQSSSTRTRFADTFYDSLMSKIACDRDNTIFTLKVIFLEDEDVASVQNGVLSIHRASSDGNTDRYVQCWTKNLPNFDKMNLVHIAVTLTATTDVALSVREDVFPRGFSMERNTNFESSP